MTSIKISEQDVEIIQTYVEREGFGDASEVVHAALSLFDERQKRLRLKAEIQLARDELERGEGVPYTRELFERIVADARANYRAGKQVSDIVKL